MQICTDTSEAVELIAAQGLYLKPVAKVSICVQLPQMKVPGKAISNWEVMEKIKNMIKPQTFSVLKVTKSTLEFIRFEGETDNRANVKGLTGRLENKTIKLSGFPDLLKVRATEAKTNFPSRHDWDSYFRDAKNMNEMKFGERPDTIHFRSLPCKWFSKKSESSGSSTAIPTVQSNKPSEYVLKKVFETFGDIRLVSIPMLDPYLGEINKKNGTIQTFSFGQELAFEAFVQYKEYIGFVKAMTALKGMKLMHKGDDGKCYMADIRVDFDKSKYLSEENMKKRELERQKIIQLEKAREERVMKEREDDKKKKAEEKRRLEEDERERERKREEKIRRREERQQLREEKRRQKLLQRKLMAEEKRKAEKKLQEKRQKLMEIRKTEASRMLSYLFAKIKEDKQKEEVQMQMQELERERLRQLEEEESRKAAKEKAKQEEETKRRQKLAEDERILRERLLKNLKKKQEQRQEDEREKLRNKLAGKARLKSVLLIRKDDGTETERNSRLKSFASVRQPSETGCKR